MKAKKTIPAPVQPEITIASLKDAGYKFAGLKDRKSTRLNSSH